MAADDQPRTDGDNPGVEEATPPPIPTGSLPAARVGALFEVLACYLAQILRFTLSRSGRG